MMKLKPTEHSLRYFMHCQLKYSLYVFTTAFIAVVVGLLLAGHAHAAFQNAQTGIGGATPTTQIAFIQTPLRDVVSTLMPASWRVTYSHPDIAQQLITVKDTGTWDQLIRQLLGKHELLATIDQNTRTVSVSVAAKMPPKEAASTVQSFQVQLNDQNIRNVITRWAQQTGWSFRPEHWVPNVDIPVVATDTVVTDFKSAIRRLLSSTELTDYAVQPCFYSNGVLRVVPIAQACNRAN